MSKYPSTSDLNIEAEATLDPSIQFGAPLAENPSRPSHILLTGSTGRLGGYLLGELLCRTSADMHCLVRGQSPDDGRQRLINNLQFYGRWQDNFHDRIIPISGDLSQPLFGLSEPHFDQLSDYVDVIYHSGGWVNNVRSYALLKPSNVDGTQEVIRLAARTKTKPVHFVSSLAVFFTAAHAGTEVVESDVPQCHPDMKSGYIQSKLVADRLVQNAQRRGLPAAIYRLARITADSQTGMTRDMKGLLNLLIKVGLYLEKFPVLDVELPMLPVDYASQAIAHLSQREDSLGKAFHFINADPIPWSNVLDVLRGCGHAFEEIDYHTWRSELKQQIDQNPDTEFLKLLQVLLYAPHNLFFDRPSFDVRNVADGLAGSSIVCPPIDGKLISTYLSYFQQVGLLPRADRVPG